MVPPPQFPHLGACAPSAPDSAAYDEGAACFQTSEQKLIMDMICLI